MRSIAVAGLAAVLAFHALPARAADWNVRLKLTCYESLGASLSSLRGSNVDLIAACLGVEPEHSSVAEHALTFDSEGRELRVVRSCDGAEICDISQQIGSCQVAVSESSTQLKVKRSCIDELVDFGSANIKGTMICSESSSVSSQGSSFKSSCKATLISDDDTPCELSFSTGKLFETTGACAGD